MNNILFSSKTDLWETPKELFGSLQKEFIFDLDVCALPYNSKCLAFYDPNDDGLKQWWGVKNFWWCNPPFGRSVGRWVERGYFFHTLGFRGVMLLPARTDTKWFHDYIYKKDNIEIRFIKGRLKFGNAKYNAPFPCMLVIFWGKDGSK